MDQVQGLKEYTARKEYRKALGLPEKVTEKYEMLAQGEYNRNYVFTHPVSQKKLVLRVNFGSQMHLENQIEYEYNALKLLEGSGRTPKVFYVDGSLKHLSQGIMVMEYLPGHAMDYEAELFCAAGCLADIHSVRITDQAETSKKMPGRVMGLAAPEHPLHSILEECEEMFRVYEASPLGEAHKKRKIRHMLETGWKRVKTSQNTPYRCCINTELNSTNFLINGKGGTDFLIDWEKPIYGDPAQDLGHFLAPTTTFWKTDVILSREEANCFVEKYIAEVRGRFDTDGIKERTEMFIPITCLRGITWCAMAWIQYQDPGKAIVNASTAKKLDAYLSDDFLQKIEEDYLSR
ncbi:MAG: aminoglycoside phosphotransferase family protein [Lachnospiraceae bacterium]|nr:aminoglycoside phosphotransferase family protein [Lachnospiraceae bacterium]